MKDGGRAAFRKSTCLMTTFMSNEEHLFPGESISSKKFFCLQNEIIHSSKICYYSFDEQKVTKVPSIPSQLSGRYKVLNGLVIDSLSEHLDQWFLKIHVVKFWARFLAHTTGGQGQRSLSDALLCCSLPWLLR